MSAKQDKFVEVYLRRKQKNLEYFKVNLPRIYQILENQLLTRAELVVTPGGKDVDMVVDGHSCYKGLAREYSEHEAQEFLDKNPSTKSLKTFPPLWPSAEFPHRFAYQQMQKMVQFSPITKENFSGYYRPKNVYPMVVFLGCGLGFHIEYLLKKANIINAFVIERDPEKFALSLFTVDWSSICSRFKRSGYSINFAIGFDSDSVDMRDLLFRHLKSAVPFYPYLAHYYNHLADVELAKTAMEVASDLSVISTNWSNYDDQLVRLKNTTFNVAGGATYIRNKMLDPTDLPVVILGSGPSLDHRMNDLVENRDRVIILSAGTALRPLLAAGIKPDLHIELDPKYLIYESHADLKSEDLKDIPLLATNEINPFVPTLFGKTRFYFKTDNAVPSLLGILGDGFSGCNPTCTNAAVSIAYSLGFRNIFLFGTDFGFESVERDHARTSIYGDQSNSGFARNLREKILPTGSSSFSIASVSGGRVLTRNDYYTAKRSMEQYIGKLEASDSVLKIFNCADGAVIDGTSWLSSSEFIDALPQEAFDGAEELENRLSVAEGRLEQGCLDRVLSEVIKEVEIEVMKFAGIIRKASLGGGRDLLLLANDIRLRAIQVSPREGRQYIVPAQIMMNQLLQGSMLRFLHIGLSHGLACQSSESRVEFIKNWRKQMLNTLILWSEHFRRVMLDERDIADSPWARADSHREESELVELS